MPGGPAKGNSITAIGREQLGETVGIAVQDQVAAPGQDVGGRGG